MWIEDKESEDGMVESLADVIQIHGTKRMLEAIQEAVEYLGDQAITEEDKKEYGDWAVYLETMISRSEVDD